MNPRSVPRVEALDVFVGLLSEVEEPGTFYDGICEAVCRLTSMNRVVLFLYDRALQAVRAAGSHGLDRTMLADVHATLDETPMARRALAEDRVVETSEALERELPPRYARLIPLTTLTCTPVAAAQRWFGVMFADRGGGRFALAEDERHVLWTLGKTAALAASARNATQHQDRVRALADRLDLARDIHEGVMQRLFGVSLALGAATELGEAERERCRNELEAALADLRLALNRPLAPRPRETTASLRTELERLGARAEGAPVRVAWAEDAHVAEPHEPLLQSVLREALRNAAKHAAPTAIDVAVAHRDGTLTLEVANDGVTGGAGGRGGARSAGMGLRLATFEAIQQGGVLEYGPAGPGAWRVRLAVPSTPEEA